MHVVAFAQAPPCLPEDEACQTPGTAFIVGGRFRECVVRAGCLISGRQQFPDAAAALRPGAMAGLSLAVLGLLLLRQARGPVAHG